MMPAVRKKSQILPLANDRFNACAVSAEFLSKKRTDYSIGPSSVRTHPSADIEEASVSTTWMSRSSDSRRTVISYFRYPDPNATKPDSVRNPYRPLGGSHSTGASPKSTLPSQSPTAHPIRPSAASSLVVGHQICRWDTLSRGNGCISAMELHLATTCTSVDRAWRKGRSRHFAATSTSGGGHKEQSYQPRHPHVR